MKTKKKLIPRYEVWEIDPKTKRKVAWFASFRDKHHAEVYSHRLWNGGYSQPFKVFAVGEQTCRLCKGECDNCIGCRRAGEFRFHRR